MRLEYGNMTEKTEAFSAIHNLALFYRQNGHPENAENLLRDLNPFIANIPVRIDLPCKY